MGCSLADQPVAGIAGVLYRGGETPFRCQAVVHRQQGETTLGGQATAQCVVGIEAADHVAAAVEIQDHGLQSVDRFAIAIQARRQTMAIPRGNGEVLAGNAVQRHVEKA
ncbi:hypothetical protein D3C86_1681130 [compost metagenome]